MARVMPAILTDSPGDLEKMVRQAESFTDYIQLDIMDGRFVPSRSITSEEMQKLHTGLRWEAHLMVEHPENFLKSFRKAGASRIIFHYEATDSPRDIISLARSLNLSVGLAINPETPISEALPFTDIVDSLLLLSVHPGFYGAKFIPEVVNKVAEIRKKRPDLEIGIDGGIKENNIAAVASSGLDVIYVGSAIFLQPDPAESFRRLSALARTSQKQD